MNTVIKKSDSCEGCRWNQGAIITENTHCYRCKRACLDNYEPVREYETKEVGEVLGKLMDDMEFLRIDIDTECQYGDPKGVLRDKYEKCNEMLSDCIDIVERTRRAYL